MLSLSLLAVFAAAESEPSRAAIRLLDAVEAGDLATARGTLSPDVMIKSEGDVDEASTSSLEDFARFVDGCQRGELTSDIDTEDPSRASVTVTWTCPSRGKAQAFIWTDKAGVVDIQFGPAS